MNDEQHDEQAQPDERPPLSLDEVADAIIVLSDKADEHDKMLDKIVDFLAERPDGPWVWRTIEGEAREKLWADLYDWVNWLDDRYLSHLGESYRIVEQWYRHPVVVELLTALMVSYYAVYRPARATPSFDLVEWHERCLWPTFQRINALSLLPAKVPDTGPWRGPEKLPGHRADEAFATFLEEDTAQLAAE